MKIFADKHSWHEVDRRSLLKILDRIGNIRLHCIFEMQTEMGKVSSSDWSMLAEVKDPWILINNPDGSLSVSLECGRMEDEVQVMFTDQGDESTLEFRMDLYDHSFFSVAIKVGELKLGWREETFAALRELIGTEAGQ